MVRGLILFVLQFVSVVLLTVNFRAIAKGRIGMAVATDGGIFTVQAFAIKIAATANGLEQIFYVAGSMLGSVCGMWLTKHWKE